MPGKSEKVYVTCSPVGEINLALHPNAKEQSGFLTLKNVSDTAVGFKFRARMQNEMTVTPSRGVLQPSEEKTMTIVCFIRDTIVQKPEKLQVLVTPVDEKYKKNHDLQDLFTRAPQKDIQEESFHLRYGSTMQLGQGPDRPLHTEIRNDSVPTWAPPSGGSTSGPLHSTPVQLRSPSQATEIRDPHYRDTIIIKTGSEDGGRCVDTVYCDPRNPEETIWNAESNVQRPRPESYPHYNLHMSSTSSDIALQKLPLGERLLRKFSRLGMMLGDLSEENRYLRDSQKWSTAFFWLVFFLMLALVYLLVVLPLYRRRQRRRVLPDLSAVIPGELTITAVENIGETFIENRRGLTLDETIHRKMAE